MPYRESKGKLAQLWLQVVSWRERHIREKNFLILLALVVGVICGFAAQLLKSLIHLIAGLLTSHLSTTTANWV